MGDAPPQNSELWRERMTVKRLAGASDAHRFNRREHGEHRCSLQPEDVSQRDERCDRIARARIGNRIRLGVNGPPAHHVHECAERRESHR